MERLGRVGDMDDALEVEYGFWRLVTEKGFTPAQVDEWTLGEIDRALAVMDMGNDWQTAISEYQIAKQEET